MAWYYAGAKKAVAEVTYYTCLKMLSETMGKLPLKYYQQTERGRVESEASRKTRIAHDIKA